MKFKECNSCENARWYGGFACVDCDCLEPGARPTQFKSSDEAILASVRKVFCAMQRATDVAPLCSMRESPPEKVAYDRDWHWKACLKRALDGDPDPMRETERPITRRWAENALAGIMVGGVAAFLAKQKEESK